MYFISQFLTSISHVNTILSLLTLTVAVHSSSSALVIATWNNKVQKAVESAAIKLSLGHSSLDAVEEACTQCEELQCGFTVGYGGSPDEAGETTLDAMIMDGTNMNIGAVGALRRVKNAIGVARKVLEHTEHTLLVGNQATSFAIEMGFSEETLTTRDSKRKWKDWRDQKCQPNFWTHVKPDPTTSCGPYKPINFLDRFAASNPNINEQMHDTIGVVSIDLVGNVAAGTSTNGAIHKIPGRVGDSPIPGAGAYAEQGIGAAAATGDGDIMMRFLPSLLAIEGLRQGLQPVQAARNSIQRIAKFYPHFSGAVVVVNQSGSYAAACHGLQLFPFSVGMVLDGSYTVFGENVTCS